MSKGSKSKDKSKRAESKSASSESTKRRKSASSSSSSSSFSNTASVSDVAIRVPDSDAGSGTVGEAVSSRTVTSAFCTLYPILNLPIAPVWSSDPYSAFSDLMDTLVMRYVPQLSGVLITHSPTRFLQDTAVFSADSAFATASVGFECVVWTPRIGQMLEGNICLSSPSHVSLLLYGLFNASIPASHLPEEFEFVLNDAEATDHGMGYWRSKVDGSKLGASDGKLSFTVISLTVANHMLSLHGSLLDEPFKGPPPTLDRSYLKKSLLPWQALGLGRTRSATDATAQPATPTPPPRRVRWQDEDDTSAVESDDLSKFDTPPSIVQAKSPKSCGTKRKSTSAVTHAQQDEPSSTSPPKRDKKRRKQA
ncbi:DNA-directed RNA polymerase I subunit RPA43 [Mycosarcoma maydis]|uniref:RPA43 OB domain-containing protein n=1 Tax=Mycosarcoma maydis TaxID=5270 RepID=A0A0D1E694_MYCMD|nr:DNA-directed RNA polymerase I subunit RPA43 [Ustilago maydis 521]KIS71469.1 hypothetical protein UMAG_01363 [Ustilago maydis 521]|eukprot:XP_011387255.1 hypothetical protein UMAG_01363 [Ustilago maydis 521]